MKSVSRLGCFVYEQHFVVPMKSKYQLLLRAKKSYVPPFKERKPSEVLTIRVRSKGHTATGNFRMPHSSWITSNTHLSEMELDRMSRGKNGLAYPFVYREELVLVLG